MKLSYCSIEMPDFIPLNVLAPNSRYLSTQLTMLYGRPFRSGVDQIDIYSVYEKQQVTIS